MSEFEKIANELVEEKEENLLVKLDAMEENIKLADSITKEYNKIKKTLKEQMLSYGKSNNLEQIKWVTPKGIKITLSVGRDEITEEQEVNEFKEEILKEKYPKIYEECCVKETKIITLENGSNDRLVITLPKDK